MTDKKEAGRRGGLTTKNRYGPDFYTDNGIKGGVARRDDDKADYAAMGEKGGLTTLQRHGLKHFREAGVKGGRSLAQNIEHMKEIGRRGALKRWANRKNAKNSEST